MMSSFCKCSSLSARVQSIAQPSSLAQLQRKGCIIHEGNFISFRSEYLEFKSAVRLERCSNIIRRVLSVDSQLLRCVNTKKFFFLKFGQ